MIRDLREALDHTAEIIAAVPDDRLGGMPGSVVIRMHLTEELVHGWDIAVATDQPTDIDPRLAELSLALVAFLGRDPAAPVPHR